MKSKTKIFPAPSVAPAGSHQPGPDGAGNSFLTNLSLFSGAGGLDLGAKLVGGFKTVAYVEYDRYAQGVLMSRMRSGDLDDAPIFEDVRTFDGRSLRGSIDVVSGGFPCQDLSKAGKQEGIVEGQKSGLWREYARTVGEIRPRFVLVENVPGLLMGGAMGRVLGDLAELGYDARWGMHGACTVGAPHSRDRVFLVADSCHDKRIRNRVGYSETIADGNKDAQVRCKNWNRPKVDTVPEMASEWGPSVQGCPELPLLRVVDGMASGLDGTRLAGNGVVPRQSVPAWQKIKDLAVD